MICTKKRRALATSVELWLTNVTNNAIRNTGSKTGKATGPQHSPAESAGKPEYEE